MTTDKKRNIKKWIFYNVISLILGVSLILNLIYLPKYFQSKSNETINFTIIAEDDTKKSTIHNFNSLIFIINYNNLGKVIVSENNIYYKVQNSQLGHFLTSVKDDNGDWVTGTKTAYWFINTYDFKTKKFIQNNYGLDSTTIHNNDIFKLVYST